MTTRPQRIGNAIQIALFASGAVLSLFSGSMVVIASNAALTLLCCLWEGQR
jgi:hypothetical protein